MTQRYSFVLRNYVVPRFIRTNESSCNCSYVRDDILLSSWRNLTFVDFKLRNKYMVGRHIWFNSTLWSDEKLFKVNESSLSFLKYLTKSNDHTPRSSGCEDFRFVRWSGKLYAFYSKIVVPFTRYVEHFCEIDESQSICNDRAIQTQQKIEKNWQPIVCRPFECVYSYKPFVLVNVRTNVFTPINNEFDLNYRGSTAVIEYKDMNICLVHLRNETTDYHYYTHYFVVYDKFMRVKKITKPFSFLGADIEFTTYMEFKNGRLVILACVNDQLTYEFNIDTDTLDFILNDGLDNNSISKDLYDMLYKDAKENNNIPTAICLGTYSMNKDIIADAVQINYASGLSFENKKLLQTMLIDKYHSLK